VRGLRGWSTGHALESALWQWRDEMHGLAWRIDHFGAALRDCAEEYRRADQAACRFGVDR
jgi:hypothetical protein